MTEFQNVNFELHTRHCINCFESFVESTASHIPPRFSSDNAVIQAAVISVYEGKFPELSYHHVKRYSISKHNLPFFIGCIFALKQSLPFMSSSRTKKDGNIGLEAVNSEAWTSIQELILITSYCETSASQNIRTNRSADHSISSLARGVNATKSAFDFIYRNKEPIYPKDMLLLLAPYWAVALSTFFAASYFH